MKPFFEVGLPLAAKGARQSLRSLHHELKAAILDGRLKAGTRLPPTRRAQEIFGVSRNTAAEAYALLQDEGLIATRHGSGTFVAARREVPSERPLVDADASAFPLNRFWLSAEVRTAMGFWRNGAEAPERSRGVLDFRPAMVDTRLFPYDVFRRVSAKQLRLMETKPAGRKSPQGNQGNYFLREAITRHIALTRAVVCRGDDVIVTAGAQQAFDLLARVLVASGETIVAIEDPGYPPLRVAFAAAGARIVPVEVDGEGLVVERLPQGTRIICVTPSHQFPLGVTMSAERRKALVAFARRTGAVIIEDDYDGDFRFDGAPIEALRMSDTADVVFYVGTFSKCMLPALRLGFVIAPDWAMPSLVAAKNCLDWHCPTPIQTSVAAFIAEGHLARHVRKTREIYRSRRKRLVALLLNELGAWLDPVPSFYGMHVAALARGSADLDAAAEALKRKGAIIHSLARYQLGARRRSGLIFSYATITEAEMTKGLLLLRDHFAI